MRQWAHSGLRLHVSCPHRCRCQWEAHLACLLQLSWRRCHGGFSLGLWNTWGLQMPAACQCPGRSSIGSGQKPKPMISSQWEGHGQRSKGQGNQTYQLLCRFHASLVVLAWGRHRLLCCMPAAASSATFRSYSVHCHMLMSWLCNMPAGMGA